MIRYRTPLRQLLRVVTLLKVICYFAKVVCVNFNLILAKYEQPD